jgi:4a-hydroxytetrahydrobiopterin dehydratase
MDDPKRTLSPTEVAAAAPDGWHQVVNRLRAEFRTDDFAAALALVDAIGLLAEAANHHPDLTLGYGSVGVALSSHDVGGLTSRDLALAAQIGEVAARHGARSAPEAICVVELGLDTDRTAELAPAYAALLGGSVDRDEVAGSGPDVPTVWFQEHDPDHAPEPGEVEQRWHLDVWVPPGLGQARVEAFVAAGGRLVTDRWAPNFWVVADAEGNRSCVCTVEARG